jgi:hypothetical protein
MNNTNNEINEIIFNGILSMLEKQSEYNWIGTMTNLSTDLNRILNKKQRALMPGSPSALRIVINKVINRLRNRGVSIKFGRTNSTRFVSFSR